MQQLLNRSILWTCIWTSYWAGRIVSSFLKYNSPVFVCFSLQLFALATLLCLAAADDPSPVQQENIVTTNRANNQQSQIVQSQSQPVPQARLQIQNDDTSNIHVKPAFIIRDQRRESFNAQLNRRARPSFRTQTQIFSVSDDDRHQLVSDDGGSQTQTFGINNPITFATIVFFLVPTVAVTISSWSATMTRRKSSSSSKNLSVLGTPALANQRASHLCPHRGHRLATSFKAANRGSVISS